SWQFLNTTDIAIDARFDNGFVPKAGDIFEVVDAGSLSGEFSQLTLDPTIVRGKMIYDATSASLVITLLGDLNCDGKVDFDDIDPFVIALIDQSQYESLHPDCNYANADVNNDGLVDFNDIDSFVTCLVNNGCE